MYQIRHCSEGSLLFHQFRTIELADAVDELGDRWRGLYDERGPLQPVCLEIYGR